jgi:hypothetical protein
MSESDNIKSEIKKLKKISKDNCDIHLFLESKLKLAKLLEDQKEYDEAEKVYRLIERADGKKEFAISRNNLGVLLGKLKQYEKAEKVFAEVTSEDFPSGFARICINRAIVLKKNKKLADAKKFLENIKLDDGECFFRAKYVIGEIYLELGECDNAKNAFEECKKRYYYDSECSIRILEISNKNIYNDLINLREIIRDILKYLMLDGKYEEYVCHYTRPSTAFSLLKYDKDQDKDNRNSSKFRLSTIKNVNDPTEGRILFDYFNLLPNREIALGTFISCFTFNRDSLNQFRLYGKENNQEASGVSIVFKKDFFGEYLGSCHFIECGVERFANNLSFFEEGLNINESIDGGINKLPVYRCIYVDNKYEYIKLAKRSEIDFYRENKSDEYESYLCDINEKEDCIKHKFNEIKTILKNTVENTYFNESVCNLINYILLPLKFLVKHAAFEDEQECRMFFITDLFDYRIKSNFSERSMYLEYEPSVRENIKEIYLSIGASQYEDFFIRNLGDSSKVCRSRNPFRNK